MDHLKKHHGYKRTFQENKLTLSLVYPLESYAGNIPEMDLEEQIKLAEVAEKGRFAAHFII